MKTRVRIKYFVNDCRLIFLARVPITSTFLRGVDGSDLSVLRTLWFKICFVENAKDVFGIVSEVEVAVLTCNCSEFFFNGFP